MGTPGAEERVAEKKGAARKRAPQRGEEGAPPQQLVARHLPRWTPLQPWHCVLATEWCGAPAVRRSAIEIREARAESTRLVGVVSHQRDRLREVTGKHDAHPSPSLSTLDLTSFASPSLSTLGLTLTRHATVAPGDGEANGASAQGGRGGRGDQRLRGQRARILRGTRCVSRRFDSGLSLSLSSSMP
eukprot:7149430-Prymnesium_polylepis.2